VKPIEAIPFKDTSGTQKLTVAAIACADYRRLRSKRKSFHTSRAPQERLPLAIFSSRHGTAIMAPLLRTPESWLPLDQSLRQRPRWKQGLRITVGVWWNWWDYWRRS